MSKPTSRGQIQRRTTRTLHEDLLRNLSTSNQQEERLRALVTCFGDCDGNHNSVFKRTYCENCTDLGVTPNTGVLKMLSPQNTCVLMIRVVSFKNFFLGDRGVEAIFEGLFRSIPHVEVVNLAGTGMRTSSVEQMTQLFVPGELPRLLAVDIGDNPIPASCFTLLLQWLMSTPSIFDIGIHGTLIARDQQLVLLFQVMMNRKVRMGATGPLLGRDRVQDLYNWHPEVAVNRGADTEFSPDVLNAPVMRTRVDSEEPETPEVDERTARQQFIMQRWQHEKERLRRLNNADKRNDSTSPSRKEMRRQYTKVQEERSKTVIVPDRYKVAAESQKSKTNESAPSAQVFHVGRKYAEGKRKKEKEEEGVAGALPAWAKQMVRVYPKLEAANKALLLRQAELEAQIAQQAEELARLREAASSSASEGQTTAAPAPVPEATSSSLVVGGDGEDRASLRLMLDTKDRVIAKLLEQISELQGPCLDDVPATTDDEASLSVARGWSRSDLGSSFSTRQGGCCPRAESCATTAPGGTVCSSIATTPRTCPNTPVPPPSPIRNRSSLTRASTGGRLPEDIAEDEVTSQNSLPAPARPMQRPKSACEGDRQADPMLPRIGGRPSSARSGGRSAR